MMQNSNRSMSQLRSRSRVRAAATIAIAWALGATVRGRIVDLSPAAAGKIGLERKKGLAKVEVAPVTVPLADGTVKIMPNAVAMNSN